MAAGKPKNLLRPKILAALSRGSVLTSVQLRDRISKGSPSSTAAALLEMELEGLVECTGREVTDARSKSWKITEAGKLANKGLRP